jgi:hypothetical protein
MRLSTVVTIVILEAVAIVGALPLIGGTIYHRFTGQVMGHYREALWDNKGALIGFLIISAILMAFVTRHESKSRRAGITIGILALLHGTTRIVEYFA